MKKIPEKTSFELKLNNTFSPLLFLDDIIGRCYYDKSDQLYIYHSG